MKLGTVQTLRKAVLLAAAAIGILIFAVTESRYPSGGAVHELIEWVGIVAIVICILGRTWCSLYIGGRKVDELVDVGPYSVSRNPLYFFSIIGAAGAGAQVGSVALAVICGAIAAVVFAIVVRQEERLLRGIYGPRYADYLGRVPRFVPKPSLWRDEPVLTVRPPRVLTTFADALVFLVAVPLAEGFEALRDIGAIPTLLNLP